VKRITKEHGLLCLKANGMFHPFAGRYNPTVIEEMLDE
jgi:hypothetical protein